MLTGRYNHAEPSQADSARARRSRAVEAGLLTDRGLAVADVVCQVAAETGHTPSQVALAWTLHQPGVTAPIIGARTHAQLDENLGALEVILSVEQLGALERASAIDLGFPHELLRLPRTRGHAFGDTRVEGHTEPAHASRDRERERIA